MNSFKLSNGNKSSSEPVARIHRLHSFWSLAQQATQCHDNVSVPLKVFEMLIALPGFRPQMGAQA